MIVHSRPYAEEQYYLSWVILCICVKTSSPFLFRSHFPIIGVGAGDACGIYVKVKGDQEFSQSLSMTNSKFMYPNFRWFSFCIGGSSRSDGGGVWETGVNILSSSQIFIQEEVFAGLIFGKNLGCGIREVFLIMG